MQGIHLAMILSFVLTSAMGSVHRVGMCGGFAALCGGDTMGSRFWRNSSYQGGRLVTYLVAGYGAHALGVIVPGYVLGGALLLHGLLLLGGKPLGPPLVSREMSRVYRRGITIIDRNSLIFLLLLGLPSTLLPCGWLYLNVTVAAATPAPLLMVIAFWVGTLPLMTAWSAFSGAVLARLGRWFPPVRAALLIALGLFSVLQHLPLQPVDAHEGSADTAPHANQCAHHAHTSVDE